MSHESECNESEGEVLPDSGEGSSAAPTHINPEDLSDHVLRVRMGFGANCSSIGSVVDTLFATATVGAAIFAAVVAALAKETVRVAPAPDTPSEEKKREETPP